MWWFCRKRICVQATVGNQCSGSATKILFDPPLVVLCFFSSSPLTNAPHILPHSASSLIFVILLHLLCFFLILSQFYTFFLPTTPSSLSLIKLAGALIKCSSPSHPPPVGLGRALIPSPVRASLKSTARETAGFFNFPFA